MRSREYSRRLALACLFASFALCSLTAEAGKKVALVIGNSAYATSPLRNPVNDAADISAALKGMGFTVYSGADASRKSMFSLIEQFGADIRGADIALFYYSGHGVQLGGENYLIPVGAEVSIAADVETEGVQLQRVIGRMSASGAGTNIVILDACRNNPFPSASRGMERGLAVVGTKPPESVIVYSTEAGETADDGNGRNGVFTTALLKHLADDAELGVVLRAVNADVRAATSQKQKPVKYDNLTHEVFLAGTGRAAAEPLPNAAASSQAAKPSLSVSRAYGSLAIAAASGGSLYLDGAAMGELPAGAEARLDNIEAGEHALELRYQGGEKEAKSAIVEAGKSSSVSFSWKKTAPAQAPSGPPVISNGFVRVPAGSFMMGAPASEAFGGKPQHQVSLPAFSIGQYEVTQAEWMAVMGSNPSSFKGDKRLPVEQVSWYDCLVYCNKRSIKEKLVPCYSISGTTDPNRWGIVPASANSAWNSVLCDFSATGYRLPTEAEWEYACRAGTTTATAFGDRLVSTQANFIGYKSYKVSTKGPYLQKTSPVGSYPANAWGIFDMHGNVWEWCWDWFGGYTAEAQSDPVGSAFGGSRVERGGSWNSGGENQLSAFRNSDSPDFRYNGIGFRLARRP